MAPELKDDIFSVGIERSATSLIARAITSETERSSASGLPLTSSGDTPATPRRSPKKINRVMVEKSVGTIGMHQKLRTTPGAPTKTPMQTESTAPRRDSGPSSTNKDVQTHMSSSQASYYTGDEEFEEFLMQIDDQEGMLFTLLPALVIDIVHWRPVEEMLNSAERPPSTRTSSGSSKSSFSSTTSTSTTATSMHSFVVDESHRRRKRNGSPTDACPRTRARPAPSPQVIGLVPKDPNPKDANVHQSRPSTGSASIVAAHTNKTKQDRPMPRSMRDLGHSAPVAVTSNIAVSTAGVIHPDQSSETSSVPAASTRPPMADDPHNAVNTTGVIQTEAVATTKIPNPPGINAPTDARPTSAVHTKQLKSGPKAQEKTSVADELPLAPTVVAHDERKQWLLDDNGIVKGVQLEIARGITQGWWTWEDITDGVVQRLRGTNFEKAGKVAEIIGKGPKQRLSQAVIANRQAIYAELDREQLAFLEHKGRGLGLLGAWESKENWHGGCVQLTAKFEFNKDSGKDQPPYCIRLNSFGFGKSNRAARHVTSLSILQVKVEKGAMYDEKKFKLVVDRLSRPLVICGRQYCAFSTKEGKVFFVETKESYQRKPMRSMGDHFRISYRKFVKTINPMDLNSKQAMNKWLARWQLILSTSRPVLEFKPEDIYLDLDDIYGEGAEADKRQSETIMTDGCGWINLTALRLIAAITNSSCPVVVQGRIAGSKGLWVLHPALEHRTDTEPPKIWIRPSQLKVKLPPKEQWERSLRIFDLVRLPRLTVPSSLYMQTIMNMSFNGVKDGVFRNLMETGLKKEIEPLTKWDGENACVALAKAVEEAGGIMASRRSRGAGAEARLLGYVRDEDDDDEEDVATNGGLVDRDPVSGCPSSLYESTRDMLLAGFTPLQHPVVREKLKYILTQATKNFLETYHIPVPLSAEAFIVPDPCGVLNEGEIFFRCSKAIGDPAVSIDPHTFLGPVLVSRNPTRVASDVRKVQAVSHDQLLSYTDVIVFSTKGKRSLASYLGGGDYDGDTVTIIAEPTLVEGFRNSDHVPEPPTVREGFEEEVEKVSAFLTRVTRMQSKEKNAEIFKKVLSGLSDGKVGIYSTMHDCAIYTLGYDAPPTIRLAYMFTTCLDAVKSGLRIKNDVYKADSQKWNSPRPESMQKAEESARNKTITTVGPRLVRPPSLGPFILDTLSKCGKDLSDNALIGYEALSKEADTIRSKKDSDLTKPYDDTKEYVSRMLKTHGVTGPFESLGKIEAFVEPLCNEYISELGGHYGNKSPRKNGTNGSMSKTKSTAQIQSEFARRFEEGLSDCSLDIPQRTVKEVKASYAYIYGASKSTLGRGFAFAVAHDTLCAIKIQSKGGGSVSRACRDYMLISSSLVKSTYTDQD